MSWRLHLLPRSLVGRVFALYTAVLVVFVGGGLGLFYRYQFGVELEDAQLRAEALSAVIVPAVADSAVIGDYDTIRRTLERAVEHSSFASAAFIDLKGGVARALQDKPPEVAPPRWLRDAIAERLYDNNHPIVVGGRDYGVLRLSFAAERIAGGLWQQTRIALVLALISVAGGLVLIRFPLVRWLGNLGRIQAFDEAMQRGEATPELLATDELPLEFRQTFEVLGRAALSLQSQRAQAAVTLGAIADGVFTLDATGRIVFANPAACAMAGQPLHGLHGLHGLLGRPAGEVLPQAFPAGAPLQAWAGRRVLLLRAGAADMVLDTTLSPILGPDGQAAGHVLACRDMTEQHTLERRLRDELAARESALVTLRSLLEGLMQRAPPSADRPDGPDGGDLPAITAMISELVQRLQERGEQLDAIFALSPDGFVSFDAARCVNHISPAFERLTGLSPAQLLGAAEQEIEALLRARCDAARPWRGFEALRRELRAVEPRALPRREQIELVRPVQRVLQVGLREGSTAAISQVLSLRDVTHETEVDRMKTEFLSTAAHELRTPMTSIFGYAEMMMRRPLPPERQQEAMATIHRQTALMIAIVNELLDLARIEARRGKDFELQTLDLAQLSTEVIGDFKPPKERAPPRVLAGAAPAWVRVDRNKLAQALGNVLSNAYKYSTEGGEVSVQLVAGSSGSGDDEPEPRVGLRVRDRGIGMTPEQLARVGERFYRAEASGTIPGTGLGVSIVKEIIELLGGRMEVQSVSGEGTTVTLWLPRVAADTPGADAAPCALLEIQSCAS